MRRKDEAAGLAGDGGLNKLAGLGGAHQPYCSSAIPQASRSGSRCERCGRLGALPSEQGVLCALCHHGGPKKADAAPQSASVARSPSAPSPVPVLVSLADVEPEEVSWLWPPYVPLGKLTIVQGDPEVGKSWLALALATAVTTGAALPGGERRDPADVIILTAEDGLADTVRPRLDDMGADVSGVAALTAVRAEDREHPFSLANDLLALEAAIVEKHPALVIIDPLSAYLGDHVDAWRDNDVRAVLGPCTALAERHGVAMVGIVHLTKSRRDRAIYRGQGNIAFAAAARSILLVGESPDTPGLRVVAHVKGNLAPHGPSLGFTLEGGRFGWTGEVEIDAETLLLPRDSTEGRARQEAEEFLRELLADGPVRATEVALEARAAGISERTLWRAKASLQVTVARQGEPGRRGGGIWWWSLPRGLACQDVNTVSLADKTAAESEDAAHAARGGRVNDGGHLVRMALDLGATLVEGAPPLSSP